jgi:hypothetical protein
MEHSSNHALEHAPMDTGERTAADTADERAKAIARRTADLLRTLGDLEKRLVKLETLLRFYLDRRDPLH